MKSRFIKDLTENSSLDVEDVLPVMTPAEDVTKKVKVSTLDSRYIQKLLSLSPSDGSGLVVDEEAQEILLNRSSTSSNGYLHQDDFNIFLSKKDKGPFELTGSFSFSNNISIAEEVVDLLLPEVDGRYFDIIFKAKIVADTSLFEVFKYKIIFESGIWAISSKESLIGDDSLIELDIISDGLGFGQVQYTSSNYTNFVSGMLKYKVESF